MNPFTDNVIFFDAEFTSLDPKGGEIIALALVKPNGEELSLELEIPGDAEIAPWVTENVLPHLSGEKISREAACARIREFVGGSKPRLVAFVNQFDTVFLHKLFGLNEWPFFWMPLDFASMLFAAGLNPEGLFDADKTLSHMLDVPRTKDHQMHVALNDARLLREVYFKLISKSK
jgi:DNA polymerase III epsilon subunit-like protein